MTTKTERVEARFTPQTKLLAERAAHAEGLSVADYLARLVLEDAPRTLERYERITLTNHQFDEFIRVCEEAPAPSLPLQRAFKRLQTEGFNG